MYRKGNENTEMPKGAQWAANTNISCRFTGLAGGGALGPMPWGMAPGIPAAMGTLWVVTGPRVSIALGSRPAGKTHFQLECLEIILEISLTTVKNAKKKSQTVGSKPLMNAVVCSSLSVELLNTQEQEITWVGREKC